MVSIFEQAANFLFVFHSWTIFITRKLSIQLKIKKGLALIFVQSCSKRNLRFF